jgi:hypothetical protein
MSETLALPTRRCTRVLDDKTQCPSPGIWIPILLLYPSVLHGPSPPMLVSIDAALCTTHRETATVKEFATDAIYVIAEKACANAGKPWPERTLTRIKFLPYAESQLGQIKNREIAEAN